MPLKLSCLGDRFNICFNGLMLMSWLFLVIAYSLEVLSDHESKKYKNLVNKPSPVKDAFKLRPTTNKLGTSKVISIT